MKCDPTQKGIFFEAQGVHLRLIQVMLHLIWSIVAGLVVGLTAHSFLGWDTFHFFTLFLALAGAYVGGMVGLLISKPAPGAKFHLAGFLMSLLSAALVVYLWRQQHLTAVPG